MINRILVFVLMFPVFCWGQFSNKNADSDNVIEDYWDEELTPLTDLDQIVRYIHNDPFNYAFIRNVPAGTPLERELEVSSFYGVRKHPIYKSFKFHKGIDLAAKTGEFIVASGAGMVTETGFQVDLGYFVRVKHCYGFESTYGHLSKILTKKGQWVDKNTRIAKAGATGKVTGPHLHYTLRKNGQIIDPFDFLFMNFNN